ncbi:MAG TPA: tetratricopeptide repeat protein [Desulfocapsa sulfexigens]|nr:tetratricopeptide repeat protein [Desulfocapsa sulfexigens]
MKNKKVLLIGWDAADWKVIHPLLDSGSMPNLQKLIKNGVMGNLASLRPELSPMLWTSIATGKRPYKHGILGFTEPGPDGSGVRPVTNLSRKTKAIWNILNQNGFRSLVVGWWPSHPAELIHGVMVSNHYQRAFRPYGKPWPLQIDTVHPPRLRENLAKLRVHPQEVDPGLMQLFVPDLEKVDQEKNHRIEAIAKIIADATTVNRATTALMHHEEWDFTAVYFDAIDHFCHGFMDYYPPRLPRIDREEYQLYCKVVESGYIFHDVLLGTMLAEVDLESTTVILVSDHGFHSDHLRPAIIPGEPAGPAAQHRPYGIVVVSGPDTRKDELFYGSSLLDICPTVLSLFGLPVGDDMDGRVLPYGPVASLKISSIPSWDEVTGEDGSHPADMSVDPLETGEAVKRLVELGYIEEPDEDQEKAAEHARREIRFNLAKSYIDAGLHGNAIPILTDLFDVWTDEFRFGIELAHCYQAVGRPRDSRVLLEDIFNRKKTKASTAKLKIKKLKKQLKHHENTPEKQKGFSLQIRSLMQDASQNPYGIAYLLGVACHADGDLGKALECFEQAEKKNVVSAALFVQKGCVFEELKQIVKAEKSYTKALSIDCENSDALLGLCRLKLKGRFNKEAAHLALDVIALRYHTPLAHFYLGCALHRLGKLSDAIKALEQALQQNPNFPEVYNRLAYIYQNRLHLPDKAANYKLEAQKARQRIRSLRKGLSPVISDSKDPVSDLLAKPLPTQSVESLSPIDSEDLDKTIVIVSGLPRSGTSMVMQMLDAGGFSILTDKKRVADTDNPKGYLEHEGIKALARKNEWLLDHTGKAVKIVAPLLRFLPVSKNVHYRIIFIERNLDEILVSQEKMLSVQRLNRKKTPDKLLKSSFFKQVEMAKALICAIPAHVLFLQHGDCIRKPSVIASRINEFLGGGLDESLMEGVIDVKLYRNRKKEL